MIYLNEEGQPVYIADPRLNGVELMDNETKVLALRQVYGPKPQFSPPDIALGARYILGQLAVNELGLDVDEGVTRCYQWPDCPVCGVPK